jgi:hypothetical protein
VYAVGVNLAQDNSRDYYLPPTVGLGTALGCIALALAAIVAVGAYRRRKAAAGGRAGGGRGAALTQRVPPQQHQQPTVYVTTDGIGNGAAAMPLAMPVTVVMGQPQGAGSSGGSGVTYTGMPVAVAQMRQ